MIAPHPFEAFEAFDGTRQLSPERRRVTVDRRGPEAVTYDTSEEASAAAGAFLATNTTTDGVTA